jgi:pimeloyl-ACP methyl ester carboxylesterase
MRRAFADVPAGQIHYVEAGSGEPVLLLHQTPRSWAEFRHVLPLIGRRRRAIAMDTLGFGDSSPPAGEDSIEAYAEGVVQLLDALGLDRASLVGHHTGGVIAVEVAAAHPERVDRLVLSSTPLVDADGRANRPRVDDAVPSADGSHLVELWQGRQAFYPEGRHELLDTFVLDALKAGPRAAIGHVAVGRYEMEHRLPLLRAKTLLIGAPGDLVYPDLRRLALELPGARVEEIEGGMVPLPDQLPKEFAARINDFLDATS